MIDTTEVQDAYLHRLGLEAEPPSVGALFRIHRAHVERVPWETLWIHLGARWSVDTTESMRRVASEGRGGYCYHLNGALAGLLDGLGYHVTRHVGGVHGPDGASEAEMTNHLVLTVEDLPAGDNPGGAWYLDVGLGDTLHEPLPLIAGAYEQGPFTLMLEETSGVGDWHLTHDPRGSFPGMAWRAAGTGMEAFAERHEWLSTSPESHFVKLITVQRRDATGVDILRGLTLQRIGDRESDSVLTTQAQLNDALADVFGFDLGAIGTDLLDTLWTTAHAKHQAWEAAGRP